MTRPGLDVVAHIAPAEVHELVKALSTMYDNSPVDGEAGVLVCQALACIGVDVG